MERKELALKPVSSSLIINESSRYGEKKVHLYEVDFMVGFILPVVLAVHTMFIFDAQLNGCTVAFLSMSGGHASMHVKQILLSGQHPLFWRAGIQEQKWQRSFGRDQPFIPPPGELCENQHKNE
ncbi:hypothetical protein ABES32_01715 [Heyndrickxia coagulans]|uniref:hypothetical protein n=1 Tax=Heyndrickxia coagulans TaxID=1398 RepID=UPI003D1AF266